MTADYCRGSQVLLLVLQVVTDLHWRLEAPPEIALRMAPLQYLMEINDEIANLHDAMDAKDRERPSAAARQVTLVFTWLDYVAARLVTTPTRHGQRRRAPRLTHSNQLCGVGAFLTFGLLGSNDVYTFIELRGDIVLQCCNGVPDPTRCCYG